MTATDCPWCSAGQCPDCTDDPTCTACGNDLDAFGHAHGCGNDPEHDHCGPCNYGACAVCGQPTCDQPDYCRAAENGLI
jgi:hypothetical protein